MRKNILIFGIVLVLIGSGFVQIISSDELVFKSIIYIDGMIQHM